MKTSILAVPKQASANKNNLQFLRFLYISRQSFQRNTKSRGTYKVSKPKVRAALEQKIPTVTVERDGGNRTSQTDDEKWRQVADQDTNDFTAKHSRIAVQG